MSSKFIATLRAHDAIARRLYATARFFLRVTGN